MPPVFSIADIADRLSAHAELPCELRIASSVGFARTDQSNCFFVQSRCMVSGATWQLPLRKVESLGDPPKVFRSVVGAVAVGVIYLKPFRASAMKRFANQPRH